MLSSLPRRCLLGALALAAARPALASSDPAPPRTGSEYVALGDFTINLPSMGRRHQYFLVAVSVEVSGDAAQSFRDVNPRLREAVLSELMKLAQRGELKQGVVDPGSLRDNLYTCVSRVRAEGLKGVVITRMMHS